MTAARRLRLWEAYFCRWDSDFHPAPNAVAPTEAHALWAADYGQLGARRRARARWGQVKRVMTAAQSRHSLSEARKVPSRDCEWRVVDEVRL